MREKNEGVFDKLHPFMQCMVTYLMGDSEYEKHDKITESTLKPVTKVKSKLDKELQEWEVESTKEGQDSQGK
jgi:hypothetical protein